MGHRAAAMTSFHLSLFLAVTCASPHDKPISFSSCSTVFLQVVLGLPLFLLPAGVHLRATLGILSGDIDMPHPSEPAFLYFLLHTCTPGLLIQVVVRNFVGPEDVADPSQAAVVKGIDFVYVSLDNSPAFRAIK